MLGRGEQQISDAIIFRYGLQRKTGLSIEGRMGGLIWFGKPRHAIQNQMKFICPPPDLQVGMRILCDFELYFVVI